MACKDEYEVGRLYTAIGILETTADRFVGRYQIDFRRAPSLLARRAPATKRVRGTPYDIFGVAVERQMEQGLMTDYGALLVDDSPNARPGSRPELESADAR